MNNIAKLIKKLIDYGVKYRITLPVICFILGLSASHIIIDSNDLPENINTFSIQNSITTCFTPPKGCAKLIEKIILSTKNNLYIQAYGFTHPEIIDAILHVAKKGVKVTIILDKSNITSAYSGIKKCHAANIPVFIDTVASISHNKIILSDIYSNNRTLITGSFNFSKNADTRNAENLLVIKQKDIILNYKKNFDLRLNKSLYYTDYIKKYEHRYKKK
ncbi:MAG: phospholipase D-like domain-containing protein [Pseudomonadota bacterium]